MDRNIVSAFDVLAISASLSARRAWIEICVCVRYFGYFGSLSARRAWIEITDMSDAWHRFTSLSARRAWIEIFVPFDVIRPAIVALRKESVDRNVWRGLGQRPRLGRSPQGERG